jgi:acyl carrier protein
VDALCREYGKSVDDINVRQCETVQDLADLFLN